MFPKMYVTMQCKVVADCFQRSGLAGIDSDDFARKFMTSDYGVKVIQDGYLREYAGGTFMLEGFTREMEFKKGLCYNPEVLWFTGYLYKYWVSYKQADPREIYKIAPISLIGNRFGFYHTQGWEYVIEDIKARPYR